MKRIFLSFFIVICTLALFAGCANTTRPTDLGKVNVVATIFPQYDFIREIAGEHVNLTMLLPPGTESHSYEPTPQDIILIQNCDIFVYVGGDSDAWVHKILDSMDTSKMKIITLMDCVDIVEEELVEGMEGDHEHDEDVDEHDAEEHEYDEHVWTSPKNAKIIVQTISNVLCETDAENADIYKENTAAYLNRLDDLDAKFQDVVDSAARNTLVFGDRFPFRYLADAYGLEYFAAFPGCAAETEASAATVAFLIDKVSAENIPVVFHVELSNQKMANIISEETGAKVLLFHACHNVTKDEMANGVSYIDLMNQNVVNLKEALK